MPNRIIKESIWTSHNLNKLSPSAERHFYRILLACDDWGCVEITPPIIKGKCYPLAQSVDEKSIIVWNAELIDNQIIKIWEIESRVYGQFIKFEDHNELTEKHKPKTPPPPWVSSGQTYDPRVATKTHEAYSRIEAAIIKLNQNGHKPRYREIATESRSSLATVVKYVSVHGIKGKVSEDRDE